MDRRGFFSHLARQTGETVVREAGRRVESRARHWIRPPFALAELDFLLACSRCGDCMAACPHGVIFPLPARRGADVVNTPALDLLNQACHLCEDWPCVRACEAGALQRPEIEAAEGPGVARPLPKLAGVRIDEERCLPFQGPECGACVPVCPVEGALVLQAERPYIDAQRCAGCALCRQACVVEPPAMRISR